uniref:Transmembrane protein 19 n=1 Tax=Ditylum brightwellii TaxID=49249 RepID=A0A7S4QGG2_9STRA
MATKYKKEKKQKYDAAALESSMRGPSQVLACSFLAVLLSLIHVYYYGDERTIAHHATCLADTLASELGMLASSPPVLILPPFHSVPPGTNGGVTLWGTSWSLAGGFLIGLGTLLMDTISGISIHQPMKVLIYSSMCGLLGSFIDSVLGATVQASYYDSDSKQTYLGKRDSTDMPTSAKHITGKDILTNAQVNLVSVMITCILGGWYIGPYILS